MKWTRWSRWTTWSRWSKWTIWSRWSKWTRWSRWGKKRPNSSWMKYFISKTWSTSFIHQSEVVREWRIHHYCPFYSHYLHVSLRFYVDKFSTLYRDVQRKPHSGVHGHSFIRFNAICFFHEIACRYLQKNIAMCTHSLRTREKWYSFLGNAGYAKPDNHNPSVSRDFGASGHKYIRLAPTPIYSPMCLGLGWRRANQALWWNLGCALATIFAYFFCCERVQNPAESHTHLHPQIPFPTELIRRHLTLLNRPLHFFFFFMPASQNWFWVAPSIKLHTKPLSIGSDDPSEPWDFVVGLITTVGV